MARRSGQVLIMILFLLLIGSSIAFADGGLSGGRKLVAIFPVVNSSNIRGSYYLNDMVDEALLRKFDSSRYLVISGQALVDVLRRYGVEDYRWADTDTLLSALRDMHVDYSVRTEILAVSARQKVSYPDILLLMKTWVVVVPLNCTVTDVPNGVVVYDVTIADQGSHESFIGFASKEQAARGALYQVLERFAQENIPAY